MQVPRVWRVLRGLQVPQVRSVPQVAPGGEETRVREAP